jgi:hypothetical protein
VPKARRSAGCRDHFSTAMLSYRWGLLGSSAGAMGIAMLQAFLDVTTAIATVSNHLLRQDSYLLCH